MNRHGSMNRAYRLVWSAVRDVWVPVAESARGRGLRASRVLVAAALSAGAAIAQAGGASGGHSAGTTAASGGPSGGQVTAGSGSIAQSGALTTITQHSATLSLSWSSFNIAPQDTVDFVQPSTGAIAVNRIVDTNGTQILGHLNANGQVYLINPNGIVFGPGAELNIGGLVASTLDLDPASLDGNARSFSANAAGNGTDSIVNEGTIAAAPGGYVALLGSHVGNRGVINAQLGSVALAGGSAVTLSFDGSRLLHLQVDQSVWHSVTENRGVIQAEGGQVVMTAGARDALVASVVNNTGVIEARTVDARKGSITLLGGMSAGTVNVGGTLDASAPDGGNGGSIETSAAHVEVADGAKVTTAAASGLYGSWLIDPKDFTIAASGGDTTGAELSGELATTSVLIQSSGGGTSGIGSVYVNDAVSWSANTVLTLTAADDVAINANIAATGNSAGLIINPRTANGTEQPDAGGAYTLMSGASITLSGASPTLSIGGIAYTVINALGDPGGVTGTDLQGINGALAGHYALGSNIDASATSGWNAGAGFTPIGTGFATQFAGTFDGLGHSISGLTINRPTSDVVGLFGQTGFAAVIQNVGLVGASITGASYVGALAGVNRATISDSYMTGSVSGSSRYIGGLVGYGFGPISDSHATGTVSGGVVVGGLVGIQRGTLTSSFATGAVSGASYVGGLAGALENVGENLYATGAVQGSSKVGGLIGSSLATLSNSYATGAVTGTNQTGGLVGHNYSGGTISNSYASGSVSVTGNAFGGLVGQNDGAVTSTFWNADINAIGIGGGSTTGATGLSRAAMMTMASFSDAGWSIADAGGSGLVWRIYPGSTAPLLLSFLTPLTVTGDDSSRTYDGAVVGASALPGASYSVAGAASSGHLFNANDAYAGAINVGSYAPSLYSDQQGYDISYVRSTLTISPATLTETATPASRGYGLANPALSGSVTGFVGSDTLANATTGTLAWTTIADAASQPGHYAIDGDGLTAMNYLLVEAPGNAAALTVRATAPMTPPVTPPVTPVSDLEAAALDQAQIAAGTLEANLPDPPTTDELMRTRVRADAAVPALRIVSGGVKLPADSADANVH